MTTILNPSFEQGFRTYWGYENDGSSSIGEQYDFVTEGIKGLFININSNHVPGTYIRMYQSINIIDDFELFIDFKFESKNNNYEFQILIDDDIVYRKIADGLTYINEIANIIGYKGYHNLKLQLIRTDSTFNKVFIDNLRVRVIGQEYCTQHFKVEDQNGNPLVTTITSESFDDLTTNSNGEASSYMQEGITHTATAYSSEYDLSQILTFTTCTTESITFVLNIPPCPVPTAELFVSLDNDILTSTITTIPGENKTITSATLFLFNGTRNEQITDVNLTGAAKTVTFEYNINRGTHYYISLLLQNSCGGNSGWLMSNIVCDNKCVGYDLYSYNFVGEWDPITGTWSENAGCIQDTLIENNSPSCGYIPPCPIPTANFTLT